MIHQFYFFGIHPKKMKTLTGKNACPTMFIAALFTRGRGYTYTYSCFTFVQEKLTQHSKALRVKKLA